MSEELMVPSVDLELCLGALDAVERARARGDIRAAQGALEAAIGAAPLELMPYLKLGRERFVLDLLDMESPSRKKMRAFGMVSGAPKPAKAGRA